MELNQFKQCLRQNRNALIRFRLPDGSLTAPHAHITEVGLVRKSFIDCGGTVRQDVKCQLQSWVADDLDHRLPATKLLAIIDKAAPLLGDENPPVEVEHDIGYATQFQIVSAELENEQLILQLAGRHTACLAPEKCCPPSPHASLISVSKRA